MTTKRALISVSDKTGVVEFSKELRELSYEIISTGGTQKALEEARSEKVIGKSLEAHLTIYANEEVETLLTTLDSDIAQLLIVSQLSISRETAPEGALVFDDFALTVSRAEGQVCERCRRTDPSVGNHANPHLAMVCDHCARILEEHFPQAVAEGFETK